MGYKYQDSIDIQSLIAPYNDYYSLKEFPFWTKTINKQGLIHIGPISSITPQASWNILDYTSNYGYKCKEPLFVKRGSCPDGKNVVFQSNIDYSSNGGYYYFIMRTVDDSGEECLEIHAEPHNYPSYEHLVKRLYKSDFGGYFPSHLFFVLQGAGGAGGPCRGNGDGCGGYSGALCPFILDLSLMDTYQWVIIYTGKGGQGYDSNYKGNKGEDTKLICPEYHMGYAIFHEVAVATGGPGGDPANGSNTADNSSICPKFNFSSECPEFEECIFPVYGYNNTDDEWQRSDWKNYARCFFGKAGGKGGVVWGRDGEKGKDCTQPDISLVDRGTLKSSPFNYNNPTPNWRATWAGGARGYEVAGGGGGASYFANGGDGGAYDNDGLNGSLGSGGGGGGYAVTVLHSGGKGGDGLFMICY